MGGRILLRGVSGAGPWPPPMCRACTACERVRAERQGARCPKESVAERRAPSWA